MSIKKVLAYALMGSLLVSCSQQSNLVTGQNSQINTFSSDTRTVRIEKPQVIDMPSPNQNARPDGTKINTIVLHHTATAVDARATGRFFLDPKAQVSSHYIVDRTGYIVQPVADNLRAWHAGKSVFNGVNDVNNFSIGIEICNLGDNVDPYPDAEYDSIIKLVSYLVKTYNIPLANITRHRDVAIPAGRKTDTSDNFSVKRVVDGVNAMMRGEYSPTINFPETPLNIPSLREVTVKSGENTLKIVADNYLDNEARVNELVYLNPQISNPNSIKVGTKVKIPTTYDYYYQLSGK